MTGTINLGYTPIDGTRLSLLLRARQSIYGFDYLGDPNFDDDNATGRDSSLIGRVGVHSTLFGGTFETGLFVGRVQEDRALSGAVEPGGSQSGDQGQPLPELSHRCAVEQHAASRQPDHMSRPCRRPISPSAMNTSTTQ